MKILPVSSIREADAYTIINEPIADIDLMERASCECFKWLQQNIVASRRIIFFCGTGNNGGDGLAIARMMISAGFHPEVFIAGNPEKMTPSCHTNYKRLPDHVVHFIHSPEDLPVIGIEDVVVDALIGSGLSRPAGGFVAEVIAHINNSQGLVIAIDVPSGLLCDSSMKVHSKPDVIRADHTLTFAPPKLAFFFPENASYTGNWHLLDIGIHPTFLRDVSTSNYLVEEAWIQGIIHRRPKFAHKGLFGHGLLIGGSYGKMGAAVLAARACLRSGAGLVTVRIPASGLSILQTSAPEAMASPDVEEHHVSALPDLAPFHAIGVGPGIGMHKQTVAGLKVFIQEYKKPAVFDADAINILSENKTWLGFITPHSIFTPHFKEFERLTRKADHDFDRFEMQKDFSKRFQCFVVLKGAFTAITTPEGICYFNPTGNPGMATGGSGDVLTGMITGILSQGYTPLEACLLGVYLHGLAGDLAQEEFGPEALIAGDIINYIGKAYKSLYGKF